MPSQRVLLRFALVVLALLMGAGLAAYTHKVFHFDADKINYYLEGQNDARGDLQSGKIRIKDAPTDKLKDRIYKEILERIYGIGRDRLTVDAVPQQLAEYIRGYNEVMDPAIADRLGAPVLDQVRQRANTQFEQTNETEKYSVYSAIVREIESNPKTFLVIGSGTWDRISNLDPHMRSTLVLEEIIEEYNLPPLTAVTASLSQAVEDYKAKNERSEQLKPQFSVRSKYVLLTNEEFESFFDSSMRSWKEFYKKYPDSSGYITFSRVGFNREMTEALVYVERRCGSLCADGKFHILKKENETWNIKHSIPFYAS